MRRTCQGYWGSYVDLEDAHHVGPDREVFFPDCYERQADD